MRRLCFALLSIILAIACEKAPEVADKPADGAIARALARFYGEHADNALAFRASVRAIRFLPGYVGEVVTVNAERNPPDVLVLDIHAVEGPVPRGAEVVSPGARVAFAVNNPVCVMAIAEDAGEAEDSLMEAYWRGRSYMFAVLYASDQSCLDLAAMWECSAGDQQSGRADVASEDDGGVDPMEALDRARTRPVNAESRLVAYIGGEHDAELVGEWFEEAGLECAIRETDRGRHHRVHVPLPQVSQAIAIFRAHEPVAGTAEDTGHPLDVEVLFHLNLRDPPNPTDRTDAAGDSDGREE